MEKPTAEIWIKIIAIINYLSAVFGSMFGILFIVFGGWMLERPDVVASLLEDIPEPLPVEASAIGIIVIFVGMAMIILSIVSAVLGWGVWTKQEWARIITIVFSWIGIAWIVLTIASSLALGVYGFFVELVKGMIAAALYGVLIWFMSHEDVKAIFKSTGQSRRAVKKK